MKLDGLSESTRATGSEQDRNVKEPAPLFLQGDHGRVSLRNTRVKELAKEQRAIGSRQKNP